MTKNEARTVLTIIGVTVLTAFPRDNKAITALSVIGEALSQAFPKIDWMKLLPEISSALESATARGEIQWDAR